MMLSLGGVVALAAALQLVSAGMYAQPVVHLDAKTFKQALSVEHAAMVAFVAPWCGHCKSLGPEYSAAAQSLSPLIPFYAVDCDADANKRLCAEYQIKGFPTIKAFPRALKGAAKDYQGERKRGALVEYAKTLVPDRVKKMRVEGAPEGILQKFLAEKPQLPHALLIHPSAPSIPFLWKVLGHRFSSRMHLGYIRDTPSHDVLSALGVYDPADTTRDTPRAVVWKAGASRAEVVEHDGEMKFNALLEFLQGFTDGPGAPPAGEPKARSANLRSDRTADTPAAAASTAPAADGSAAAERRAKMQAKLEEEERRDRARREKLAAAAAKQASEHVHGDNEADGQELPASPVDAAPEPMPPQDAQDGLLHDQSSAAGVVPGAAEPEAPVPPADGDASAPKAADTERTVVHEEL